MVQSFLFYSIRRVLFDCKIWHRCYDTVFNRRDEQSEMSKLTSFYPCGWLQSWRSPFFLRGSENDFGDINVLSVWVYFKSDAYFILWHHLLTSKIPISVTAPKWYIHNSEMSVSKFGYGLYFGGYYAFGHSAICNIVPFWVLTCSCTAWQNHWYLEIFSCFLVCGT